MKMKDYMALVEELNNYLSMFPDYIIVDELHEDELLDIYEYGIPKTWFNNL
jgi:type IV secretory pathway ATPase VirB11/archaellum biosynthesis ATPase